MLIESILKLVLVTADFVGTPTSFYALHRCSLASWRAFCTVFLLI